MKQTTSFKNILCIRADNMGDVIMSGPALRALKESFPCHITLLTSRMGSLITSFIPGIDEVLVADLPWVRTESLPSAESCRQLIGQLRSLKFDLAVIFTVYSQSPLPAAMLCLLADIPERLAWCRENPYQLLTKWLPDEEPYSFIRHQVERDLQLVKSIGATTADHRLRVVYSAEAKRRALQKLAATGLDLSKDWIILHPGVSETKREYPLSLWAAAARLIRQATGLQLVITGSSMDVAKAEDLAGAVVKNIYVTAGLLTIEEFIAAVAESRLVISVNTATVHIAAAVGTPVVVLYAQTNPQHQPWKIPSAVLQFSVNEANRSRNEVIRHVSDSLYSTRIPFPEPQAILETVNNLLSITGQMEQNGQVADSFK
jgi:ADP-heptose:LPS heptosyltransferase